MEFQVKLFAMGDISFGDQPLYFGFGVMSTYAGCGYDRLFSAVRPLWQESDIVFANLEGVIDLENPSDANRFEDRIMRGPQSAARALAEAGINLVSLSNNHILDHGAEAIQVTTQLLETHHVKHVGSSHNRHCIVERDEVKVGFIAWSLVPDGGSAELNPRDHYNITDNEEDIFKDVAEIRPRVDYLVLSLHWGNEFVTVPSSRQVDLAHSLVDRGVDVLIGHHPHVLQPIEMYRQGLILYSLGNFVFDYWINNCNLSAVIEIDLAAKPSYKIHPIEIDHFFAPKPASVNARIQQIESALQRQFPLPTEAYAQLVYRNRQRMRLTGMLHIARNSDKLLGRKARPFWTWLAKRIGYLIRISLREKSEPEIVYRDSR